MKLSKLILGCILLPNIIFAQTAVEENINNTAQITVANVWYPAYKNYKMGYINVKGQEVADFNMSPLPAYKISNFAHNFITIKSGDVIAAYTKKAATILDDGFTTIYFDEETNLFRASKEVNTDGKGFNKKEKIGYYTIDGKEQIAPNFTCGYFDCGYGFKNGLCYMAEQDKIGFINTNGAWIIKPAYYYTDGFSNGFATISKEKDGGFGVINTEGKEVVPFVYKSINGFSKTGIAAATMLKDKREMVLINNKGKVVANLNNLLACTFFSTVLRADNGNLIVIDTITSKYGIVNEAGKIVCKPTYNGFASTINNNIMVANINGQRSKNDMMYNVTGGSWVLVNVATGKEICQPFEAEKVESLEEGMMAFLKNGKWGFMNDKAEVVIPASYEFKPSNFENGLARIFGEDSYESKIPLMGYINKAGVVIWAIQN